MVDGDGSTGMFRTSRNVTASAFAALILVLALIALTMWPWDTK